MSYAVRNDGLGWRAVDGPEDCALDERWQPDQPELILHLEEQELPLPPLDKLKAFLLANPDVVAAIEVGS